MITYVGRYCGICIGLLCGVEFQHKVKYLSSFLFGEVPAQKITTSKQTEPKCMKQDTAHQKRCISETCFPPT